VYTPTCVLHGTRNATQNLQFVLVVMMDDIKSNIKVWLDDCLLHTKTEDDLLGTLNFFFKQCQKCSAARTNVVLRIVMSTITVVLLVSSLPLYFYTMTSHRDIYVYNC
jgi:hypothetical protein